MNWLPGKVIAGYGVASGQGNDHRYPAGTIKLQMPYFLEHGIDLSRYFPGTLNVDLAPYRPLPQRVIFDEVIRWYGDIEERFALSMVSLKANDRLYEGLWYYPYPETKPDHFQQDTVVELLMPWIDGVTPNTSVLVSL